MLLGNCPFPELNWEVKRLRAVSTAALDGLEELFKSKSFTQAMLSLLICSGLNSELPEFKDRKSFVLLSLEADRPDLLELLLKYGASALADIMSDNGKRSCAYNIAIQRGRMECLELIRLKHVIPINGYCYAHQPALASLVESEHLSESEMITVAAKLLGWGAHPLRKRHGHQDAPTIARARGLNKIARFLEENYSMYGPAYVREARKRKIKDLCLHYNKANGLIFRIADFDFPFFVGGDYDGAYPTTAKDAWSIATKEGGDSNFTCVEWFLPFLERIAAGQEISFDSLMKFQSRFSIYTDEQPSNWD
jgi:hypothetical protein